MNEDSKKTLLIGGISFLALSIVFRLLRGYIFSENVFGKFPWDNQLGVIFIVLGFIMFIVERWMNAPFFYGKSQKGGSNSNSFFLMAVAMLLFDVKTSSFIILLVICISFIIVGGSVLTMLGKKHRNKKK